MKEETLALASRIDVGLVRKVYRQFGRAHLAGVLQEGAAKRLHRALEIETPWRLALCDGEGHHDLTLTDHEAALPDGVQGRARDGFAYRYANFRLDEHYELEAFKPLFLMRFYEFLNSAPFLEFARAVTGIRQIAFADAQATLYRPGDFLNVHDDNVAGKQRYAAYVFNFTPRWRPDWGGLLAFPDEYGHFTEAFAPSFNALNLLRVPSPHLVTQVASFAGAGRYSITGWLRGR